MEEKPTKDTVAMSLQIPDTDQMDKELVDNPCTIPEYYSGKVIFLTGFTGFMGKLMVEKILWSCPDVKLIYLLVRPKKGLSPQQRVHSVIKLPIFDRLREREGEDFLNKLVALPGDTSLPGLGLAQGDKALLRETNIIFNGAASVRFDDPLPNAIKINTFSAKSLIDLALEMPNLDCFVHLSTAYVNCDLKDGVTIKEQMYPPLANWEEAIKVTNKIDPSTFSTLSYKYSQHMPNTYVFSKRLGENVLSANIDRIPVIIVRPSIVISTIDEPLRGWIDNLNGPVGLLSGYGVGIIRTSLCSSEISPDFVPVDIVNRVILSAPWFRAHLKKPKNLMILHACASDHSITNQDLVYMGNKILEEYPMKLMMWKPTTHITDSKFWFTLNVILFQLIPAIVIDSILKFAGKKQILWKLQIRVYVAMMALVYFTTNHFKFNVNNCKTLSDTILKKDHNDFYIFKELIDHYSYFSHSAVCFQKTMLHQKEEDLEKAKFNNKMFVIADALVKISFWSLIIWNIYKHQVLMRVFYFMYNGLTNLLF